MDDGCGGGRLCRCAAVCDDDCCNSRNCDSTSSKVFFCFVAFIARPQKVGKNPALCAPPPRHSTTTLARKAAIVAPSGYLELKHHTRWPPTLVSPASRAASILPAHIQFNYCKCFAAPPNTTHHIKAPSHPLFEATISLGPSLALSTGTHQLIASTPA